MVFVLRMLPVLALAVALTSCGSDSAEENSPAMNLAVIEQDASPDDDLVAEFEDLLATTEASCGDSQERISDYTINVQNQLRDAGISESPSTILRAVSEALDQKPVRGKVKCLDAFTFYSITRIRGK